MLICIEGCIGVGKTTLTRILCQSFNAEGVFEDFENNPFLIPYYQKPKEFSFHVQLCFLLLQHAKLLDKVIGNINEQAMYISDFSIIKTKIFSNLVLTPEQYKLLSPIYLYLTKTVRKPNLIIYLYGSVPLIMNRIQQRAHLTDNGIQVDYISSVSSIYNDFFASYKDVPTISVNIDTFDCMSHSQVNDLVTQIRQNVGDI